MWRAVRPQNRRFIGGVGAETERRRVVSAVPSGIGTKWRWRHNLLCSFVFCTVKWAIYFVNVCTCCVHGVLDLRNTPVRPWQCRSSRKINPIKCLRPLRISSPIYEIVRNFWRHSDMRFVNRCNGLRKFENGFLTGIFLRFSVLVFGRWSWVVCPRCRPVFLMIFISYFDTKWGAAGALLLVVFYISILPCIQ